MAGKAAMRRANTKRAKARKERKKADQQAPTVTEDDLLAFQFSHFGDDTKPVEWFVPAETVLNYNPAVDADLNYEDDGLGYYEDGVKRTLTDEQIEIFRHSEMEMMLREERLQKELNDDALLEVAEDVDVTQQELHPPPAEFAAPISESNLTSLAQAEPIASTPIAQTPTAKSRAPSQSGRSDASSLSTDPRRRQRKLEIPYEERHKRKWEDYIEENDPEEGSLTHRRIVREMDEMQDTSVELDY